MRATMPRRLVPRLHALAQHKCTAWVLFFSTHKHSTHKQEEEAPHEKAESDILVTVCPVTFLESKPSLTPAVVGSLIRRN